MKTLYEMQKEHISWSQKNFPNETWQDVLMGVVEEVGELNHYLLKQKQGIRGTSEEHEAGAKDSVGDIVIYLMHVCNIRGWDMQEVVEKTHAHVLSRDWTKDKHLGVTATPKIQGQHPGDIKVGFVG
jgi:NTP pyrophosphatase (non-canonical NTP hydrolase)